MSLKLHPAESKSDSNIDNINIESHQVLLTPAELKALIPLSDTAKATVIKGRETVRNILEKKDKRLLVVVGPCSIHDTKAAIEYAQRLKSLQEKVGESFYLVMRVYFEKPRTTVGWKGLINDPHLNDTFEIEEGLKIGRQLLLDLAEMGVPTGTEALDPISPQYLQSDLVSWSAIGARTTESQTHREMSSGLSTPVGFKNGTDGGLTVAINALLSVSHPHSFLGINRQGQVSVIKTKGNQYSHIVLRGGNNKPNFDAISVAETEKALNTKDLPLNIMIDCSHANSNKDASLQAVVLDNVTEQILRGNKSVFGLMIESHLHFGNQKVPKNSDDLKYGVSITDACISWETTEQSLLKMALELKEALQSR